MSGKEIDIFTVTAVILMVILLCVNDRERGMDYIKSTTKAGKNRLCRIEIFFVISISLFIAIVVPLIKFIIADMFYGLSCFGSGVRCMFQLGEDVFDCKKQYSVPVFGVGNTLFYTARDPKMNTNAMYSFNIDTYEKKRVYAKSAMIDTYGFLGLNELFGITNGYSMGAFSQINKYILFDEKLMPATDATTCMC